MPAKILQLQQNTEQIVSLKQKSTPPTGFSSHPSPLHI